MAKKTRNRKNTDGDDLIDDDVASVAVAEKPERKAKVTSKAKSKATPKPKASSGKRLRTTVDHKAPKAGSKFTAKYKGKTYTMTTKDVKGVLTYFVKGKAYKNPSAAALPVVKRERGPNGWTFWGIEKVR